MAAPGRVVVVPSFTWQFRGVDRIRNSLRTMAQRAPIAVDDAMREWAEETRTDLKATRYPPAPMPKPGRKPYRRTGRLTNSWYKTRQRVGRWEIGNRARRKGRGYAGYVVGDNDGKQAWMHKSRWWKAVDEIAKRLPRLRRLIEQHLEHELRRNGL
jgi:hypothetical protein